MLYIEWTRTSSSLWLNGAKGCLCVSCLCNAIPKYSSLRKVEISHLHLWVQRVASQELEGQQFY